MQIQNSIGLALKICLAVLIFLMENPIQAQTISSRKIGSSWPTWKLLDFQPKSPKHNQTYGLEQFRGRVTLVALLATWCPYCQRQIEKMEQLRKELSTNKFEVNFAVVNIQSGKDSQDEFISRCSFPLFQDTKEINAFSKHQGGKDDFYIYNERGELTDYFPFLDERNSNLTDPKGYENVKRSLLKAPYKTKLTANSAIKITIEGVQGRTYDIQFSEDLGQHKSWQTLKKITLESNKAEIIDMTTTKSRKQRFYRTVEAP